MFFLIQKSASNGKKENKRKQLSIKVLRFLILGEKYIGCKLSLGQISWKAVFLGAICPSGNYVGDKSSERQFSSRVNCREILSGAILFGVVVQEQ